MIDVSGSVEHLPQVWSDVLTFGFTLQHPILGPLFRALVNNFPSQDEGDMKEKYKHIIKSFTDTVKQAEENTNSWAPEFQ